MAIYFIGFVLAFTGWYIWQLPDPYCYHNYRKEWINHVALCSLWGFFSWISIAIFFAILVVAVFVYLFSILAGKFYDLFIDKEGE